MLAVAVCSPKIVPRVRALLASPDELVIEDVGEKASPPVLGSS